MGSQIFFISLFNSLIHNSLIQFLNFRNWIQKYLHFGIILKSSGVMYSMDNIEIENTLSIKQIFQLFPCLYFESQGNTNNRKKNRKFFPTEFFLKLITGSYENYIWTMRNRGTPFFSLLSTNFCHFKEKRKKFCY